MVLQMAGVSDFGDALARWMYRVCAVRLAETISDFRWKNLCVGAGRCARPLRFDTLMVDGFVDAKCQRPTY